MVCCAIVRIMPFLFRCVFKNTLWQKFPNKYCSCKDKCLKCQTCEVFPHMWTNHEQCLLVFLFLFKSLRSYIYFVIIRRLHFRFSILKVDSVLFTRTNDIKHARSTKRGQIVAPTYNLVYLHIYSIVLHNPSRMAVVMSRQYCRKANKQSNPNFVI